jgi:hypothetical protein
MFRGILAQSLLDVGGVLCAFEVDAPEAQGSIQEVDVAIDEPGQDYVAAGFDDFGPGITQFEDRGLISDGDDFSIADSHSLRPWLLAIAGVDSAASDDGVGNRNGSRRQCHGKRRSHYGRDRGKKAFSHRRFTFKMWGEY